jgi:hypothetical protein
MDDETKSEWVALGERLKAAGAEKFFEVLRGLREVVEAQEIIAKFDWQLIHRGRPRKVYRA